MSKRFFIEVTLALFGGKLTIDVYADSEEQAWEEVNDLLSSFSRRLCELKTVAVWNDVGPLLESENE